MSKVVDIVDLLDRGFVSYSGAVPASFYGEKRCLNSRKAEWLMRPWSEEHRTTRYICLGCNRRCVAIDPAGWQLVLPMRPTRPGSVIFAPMTALTVDELLRIKRVLRTDEAAWALNISRTRTHELIQEGLLDPVPGTPTRVTAESVKKLLSPVDA